VIAVNIERGHGANRWSGAARACVAGAFGDGCAGHGHTGHVGLRERSSGDCQRRNADTRTGFPDRPARRLNSPVNYLDARRLIRPLKATETRPLFATGLANLHVHERGSVVFQRETVSDDLLAHRDANIAEPAWRLLRDHFGLVGERRDQAARDFVGKLFRVAFAVLHAPSYQAEHKSALSSDWAHLPIPKDPVLFAELADAGEQVIRLLDANRDARQVVDAVLTPARANLLGQLRRSDGAQLTAADLKVSLTYWGGGKGKWAPRPFLDAELPGPAWDASWGERTGDLFLNAQAHFSHVPEAVWTYQLGGYPVLKKWLGYRQANRHSGNPLTQEERRWLRQMIQRIAALLALGPALDALYQNAAATSFTVTELGIRV
jgi:Type ISP C-terminal specificity domain